jgi:hypothetical protein
VITEDFRYQTETIPPSLQVLGSRLAAFYGVSPNNVGMKGDPEHRGGYHRSRRFLTGSPYSRDRRYSVVEPGNQGGSPDWICAIDITLSHDKLLTLCQRLDKAVRSGRFEKVAEWYGNDDGDNKVDGWDNIRNQVASSDSSHLWHVHIGFIRSRAGDDHSDLYDALTGNEKDDDEEDDVKQETGDAILAELKALNEFLMTGKRYGKAATAPPGSEQIGTLHKLLQSIGRYMETSNELLSTLVKRKPPT